MKVNLIKVEGGKKADILLQIRSDSNYLYLGEWKESEKRLSGHRAMISRFLSFLLQRDSPLIGGPFPVRDVWGSTKNPSAVLQHPHSR
jgi:hypothetical protein